ncbi:MAG: helix-turn-helix domain-containing protein [Terriglobia bacterium]|jgi:putative transcriptional regulator
MSKQAFEGIMQGLQEALAYARGDKSAVARVVNVAVKPAEIKTARKKTGMSRETFARAFGLSPATLRKWENGERQPTGAARVLLTIISREPEAVLRAIR